VGMKPGDTIDRYRVERRVGDRDGWRVLLARDRVLTALHAVHVLSPQRAEDLILRHNFVSEARSLQGLRHPDVATVVEVLLRPGPAVVSRYVQGPNLEEFLRRLARPVPSGMLLKILLPVVAGVGAIHDHGRLHLDLQPSNIVLSPGPRDEVHPVVVGLGMAPVIRAEHRTGTPASRTSMGKVAYMSPEGVLGTPRLDHRADIFALGAILYELATGRPAFQGGAPDETMRLVVGGGYTPLSADLAPALVECIRRSLASDPADRFDSCLAFAATLRESASARRGGRLRRRGRRAPPEDDRRDLPGEDTAETQPAPAEAGPDAPTVEPDPDPEPVPVPDPVPPPPPEPDEELELDLATAEEEDAPRRILTAAELTGKPLGRKYGYCPVCSACPPAKARFCPVCGTGLEIHASDFLVERSLRIIAPPEAPRKGHFLVHLDVGGLERELPESVADGAGEGAALPGQVSPEITVYLRSAHLKVLPAAPLRVMLRDVPKIKLPLTATLSDPPAAGPIHCAVDVYHCDECLYHATFDLALEGEGGEGERAVPLRKVFPAFIARACRNATERALDEAGGIPDIGQMPAPVSIPGFLLETVRTNSEYAAWIPRVFEAFLRYHVCILTSAVEGADLPDIQSLGDLREAFHRCLAQPGLEDLIEQQPYLADYRKLHYQQLTQSLVDYQLRVWQDAGTFPSEEQCAELARMYRPKLNALLGGMVSQPDASTARLVVKGGGGDLLVMPAVPDTALAGLDADALEVEVVYLWAGERLFPLSPAVQWQLCDNCGSRHVFLWAGRAGDEDVYTEVAGSCPLVQPADVVG
jgi:serine/threonine protein kinase